MAASSGRIVVLAVDDDEPFLELSAAALERAREDLEVHTATSAADGLAALYDDGTPVDCVLSDYEMPRMDGLEFLVAVRAEFPDLPFVLFTGRGSEEVASRAISLGVTDYLQKETGLDQFTVLANRLEIFVSRARERSRLAEVERELAFWKAYSPAIVVVGEDRRVVSASATCRDLFDVEALDDLVGVDVETLVHPDERDAVADVIRTVREEGGPVTCEDRTILGPAGEPTATTVQWRAITHWGRRSLLAVMNGFPPADDGATTAD